MTGPVTVPTGAAVPAAARLWMLMPSTSRVRPSRALRLKTFSASEPLAADAIRSDLREAGLPVAMMEGPQYDAVNSCEIGLA